MRALLASPPLALATLAFSTLALLAERLLQALLGGADPRALLAPLGFWIAVCAAFGAFWLVNALRLAGLVSAPASRLTGLGALATAGIGAILAPLDLGSPHANALGLAVAATCFATWFLLRAEPFRDLRQAHAGRAQRAAGERSAGPR